MGNGSWRAACAMAVSLLLISGFVAEPAEESGDTPPGRSAGPGGTGATSDAAKRTQAATRPDGESDEKPAPAPGTKAGGMEEVVVTATRGTMASFDAPAAVSVVSGDAATSRIMSRSLPEAFADTPGVMRQKTAVGHGSPYIRGFTGFRNLLLIDGIRLNNSIFRDGPNEYWNTVDIESVDRLEIVRGPSSVLYGSDAIGGTVNALTKGRRKFEGDFGWGGLLKYRGSTAEASHQGRVEFEANAGERFGFFLGASAKDFGELDAGGRLGRQRKTGYKEFDCDTRLDFFAAEDHKFTAAFQRTDLDDVWRQHRTIYGISWHGTAVGTNRSEIYDYDRYLGYVRYQGEFGGAPVSRATATLSVQAPRERRYRERSDHRLDKQGVDVLTLGASVQLESATEAGRFTYGVEYYRDFVQSFARNWNADGSYAGSSIQGPVADDSTYDLLGAYVQDIIPLYRDRLDLILGARYTYAAADVGEMYHPVRREKTSFCESWNNVVGSARLSWRADPGRHWNLFCGVSQGYRAPNLSDMTRLDTNRSNEIETPTGGGLDPETFVSCEAGVKVRYDVFSAQAAYYYTFIEDMIVRKPTGNMIGPLYEVRKKNAGSGFVHGVDLEASWRFHRMLTLSGGFSWLEGLVEVYPTSAPEKKDRPLDKMMPAQAFGSLKWESPAGWKRNAWAELVVRGAGGRHKLSPGDRLDTQRIPPDGTPGWATFTLRGGAQIYKGLDFSLALENLSDRNYRIHGSGQNEPGFNLVGTIRWKF
ncbi:MAG: TonB-dependent receptor [Planctomycetota bacterium]|nr:TonB-dependent receptor [Planctomycetota bacterium]